MFAWTRKICIHELCLKFNHLKLQPLLPGDNGLTMRYCHLDIRVIRTSQWIIKLIIPDDILWFSLHWSANQTRQPGGCFTNISRALQDVISKFVYCRNCTSYENFKLKLCMCAQNHIQNFKLKFSPLMWFRALYFFWQDYVGEFMKH